MDGCNGKRVGGLGVARKGSGLAFRDSSNNEDRSIQYCNRLGCSTRLNSSKGGESSSSDRTKYSKPPFRPASGKAISGNSTKTFSNVSDARKSQRYAHKPSSNKETVPSETICKQRERHISESIPSTNTIQTTLEPEDVESGVLRGLTVDTSEDVGRYNIPSNTRSQKKVHQQSGSSSQDMWGPSVRRSIASKSTSQVAKPASHSQAANVSQYGLRNLACTSISDVLPSGCSSPDSSRRRTDVKRRNVGGESSTSRAKHTSGSFLGGSSSTQRNPISNPSLSHSEHSSSQQPARRTRNCLPNRDGVTSVRTRRTITGEARARSSEHGTGNDLTLPESPIPRAENLVNELTPTSSLQFPAELPSIFDHSNGQPGSSSQNLRSRQMAHTEGGHARPFHGLSFDRDGFQRFNMDGIAEVLMALERIEQDEELTYEQLVILETNLFMGGLGFHDQHRDMRLDIDDMSYEELLALEEKMGTVSTALTEEALSKCLKRSFYTPASLDTVCVDCGDDDGDDVKCSICQEEYVEGDEVGKLGCDHWYHVVCIHQWLRQKNWCPICKVEAARS
ncbi:E3 ubiquitin-protein ligase MBR1-like [Macadamia integrifolia]|uniref:E3 ubiquitin-protein ligase MBR1-like n=1 Tax=Macadamia integrifolia TaxID=60698 RepID=UPI001C4EE267|nr:E3 ubiquitin-protein ligase MBR1-like [Macadamia integrifolia]XP_042481718.1 E3 ubiquitin-protein ligase MBR1-like [Macadamia integrifolia]XP_042481726.1 E3 ubiquitin-protein ligase MBR1-like [Macadamia integrifolia]XP_042481733.1 E3 ubiquitin-protein ligase MBR1-like [Macadamia integrifolia]